jgi:hypothetical protein
MDLKQMFYRLSVSPYFNVKSRYLYHASIIASLNYQTMLSPVDLCDKIDELTYYIYRRNSFLAHNIVVSPLMLEMLNLCNWANVRSYYYFEYNMLLPIVRYLPFLDCEFYAGDLVLQNPASASFRWKVKVNPFLNFSRPGQVFIHTHKRDASSSASLKVWF